MPITKFQSPHRRGGVCVDDAGDRNDLLRRVSIPSSSGHVTDALSLFTLLAFVFASRCARFMLRSNGTDKPLGGQFRTSAVAQQAEVGLSATALLSGLVSRMTHV